MLVRVYRGLLGTGNRESETTNEQKTLMKQVNPIAGDSFEKARRVFFGTLARMPKISAPLTECLEPAGSPATQKPLQAPREAHTLDCH